LHFRRFEFKYILPTALADSLIPTVTKYMKLDTHINSKGFYEVNSLYYDSPFLYCYNQKLDGVYFRKKYRIRSYPLNGQSFFEIKRKVGDIVIKDRVSLQNYDISDKESYSEENILPQITGQLKGELVKDYHHLNLKPLIIIVYKRRPYFSKFTNNLRLTFDYDLKANLIKDLDSKSNNIHFVDNHFTVLEIKTNSTIPAWLGYIIKRYNLERNSFSKYANSVTRLLINN
ncbi:hypothetical protein A2296_04985, partial [candidate division CPR3 bacterium RIFOXYB2_FULL_35_8]